MWSTSAMRSNLSGNLIGAAVGTAVCGLVTLAAAGALVLALTGDTDGRISIVGAVTAVEHATSVNTNDKAIRVFIISCSCCWQLRASVWITAGSDPDRGDNCSKWGECTAAHSWKYRCCNIEPDSHYKTLDCLERLGPFALALCLYGNRSYGHQEQIPFQVCWLPRTVSAKRPSSNNRLTPTLSTMVSEVSHWPCMGSDVITGKGVLVGGGVGVGT